MNENWIPSSKVYKVAVLIALCIVPSKRAINRSRVLIKESYGTCHFPQDKSSFSLLRLYCPSSVEYAVYVYIHASFSFEGIHYESGYAVSNRKAKKRKAKPSKDNCSLIFIILEEKNRRDRLSLQRRYLVTRGGRRARACCFHHNSTYESRGWRGRLGEHTPPATHHERDELSRLVTESKVLNSH